MRIAVFLGALLLAMQALAIDTGRAFEDPEAHYRWFVSGEGWEIACYTHDFRVGGY